MSNLKVQIGVAYLKGQVALFWRRVHDWFTGWNRDKLKYQDKQKAGIVSRPETKKENRWAKRRRLSRGEKKD